MIHLLAMAFTGWAMWGLCLIALGLAKLAERIL